MHSTGKCSQGTKFSSCGQQRMVFAGTTSFCWFCHAVAQLLLQIKKIAQCKLEQVKTGCLELEPKFQAVSDPQ